MNKKKAVNNPHTQYRLPIITQIAPTALKLENTDSFNQDKGFCASPNQCDPSCALTTRSTSTIAFPRQTLGLTWKLRCTGRTKLRRRNSVFYQSVIHSRSDSGCHKNGSYLKPRKPTLSYRPTRRTINQQPVYLVLLCLLSLAAILISLSSNDVSLVSANTVTSSLESISRPIRATKLLVDELDNGIMVRTAKHGYFKGKLIASNRSPKASDISDTNVIGFLGIRYASAPTKRLRFMPPTAYHYSTNQVHEMQLFGPICMQRLPIHFNYSAQSSTRSSDSYETAKVISQDPSRKMAHGSVSMTNYDLHMHLMKKMMSKETFNYFNPLYRKLINREQSEDCLNLNIYVPKEALSNGTSGQNPAPRAVLVVIHGESFDYGAGSTINGHKFAQQTRLITVTFNYRLNILGFPPKLAGASRGNLGLMDQVAALHWIKDNIGSFGGSPNNITLMGTKRGAIFVNLLMLSPLAKGLFQRAIMEDGSALTPIVANHIIPSTGATSQLSSSLSLQPALQHVRFLAKLCDCPVYQRATKLSTTTNGSTQYGIATSGADIQQQMSSAADEIKANALTFECLRHRPIEQIMQLVPLDLLHFNQANGELSMSSRWLKPLATTPQVVEGSTPETRLLAQSNEELAPVDIRIIDRLVQAAIKEQVEKDGAAYSDGAASEEVRLSELFSALYAPPSSSIRPLFGPVEDGTIVPGEDMAVGMLKTGSAFAQRDLLIGLSQPVISSPIEGQSTDKIKGGDHETIFELGPDHMFVDRITAHIQEVGLTNEQAVNFVNIFVRSLYKYHNQEITNSIINHYLSRVVRKRRKLNSNLRKNAHEKSDENAIKESKISQQQLFVLDSLLEAFQDALINVPLLKTSLIHAIKQLEPLVEAFIGQQFERWKLNEHGGQYESQAQMNELRDSFITFAQSLFNDTNWPLELHSPTNTTVQQPKATYLYQFDSLVTIRRVQKLIDELGPKSSVSFGWKSIKENIEALLMNLQDSGLDRRMSFECIMKLDLDEVISDTDDSGKYIVEKFSEWICLKYANILNGFISKGNVNTHNSGGDEQLLEDSSDKTPISERIVRFESKCTMANKQQIASTADIHSVQIVGVETENILSVNGTCRRELNSMVLDYLFSGLETYTKSDKNLKWPVFNIFTQHMATLPANNGLLHAEPISDGDLSTQYDQKSTFSARSSFWANYVPALNCSKTQPVIPTSLLSSSLASSNTTLLNLNLLFTCQHGGKTSYEAFELLVNSIKQQLQAKFTQWKMTQSSLNTSQQNHHSLRMANIGQTNSPDDNLDQQEHSSGELGRFNLTSQNDLHSPVGFIEANNGDAPNEIQGRTTYDLKAKYVGIVLILCALVVSVTLISGACTIIKQRKQRRNQRRKTESNLEVKSQQLSQTQDDPNLPEQPRSSINDKDDSMGQALQPIDQSVLNDDMEVQISDQNQSLGYLQEISSSHMNHVCAPYTQGGYIYWANGGEQGILDNPVALCRSHSSLNVPPNGDIFNNDNNLNAAQNLLNQTQTDQEPIMMPILTNASQGVAANQSQSQTSSLRKASCLTNSSAINGFHGDSSSETQDHSRLSTCKKRVKISDPLGTARRTYRSAETNLSIPPSGTNNRLRLNDPLYCPVHRDQVAKASVDTGYYVDEQTFLSTNNGLWNGDQTHVEQNQFIPSTSTINCDYYIAPDGTPQQAVSYSNQQRYGSTSHYNSDYNSSTIYRKSARSANHQYHQK